MDDATVLPALEMLEALEADDRLIRAFHVLQKIEAYVSAANSAAIMSPAPILPTAGNGGNYLGTQDSVPRPPPPPPFLAAPVPAAAPSTTNTEKARARLAAPDRRIKMERLRARATESLATLADLEDVRRVENCLFVWGLSCLRLEVLFCMGCVTGS